MVSEQDEFFQTLRTSTETLRIIKRTENTTNISTTGLGVRSICEKYPDFGVHE